MHEGQLLVFLLQVLLLLGLARGVGEILTRWSQPALVGEILIGVLLGPTILGRAAPELQAAIFPVDPVQEAMLETLSWFGVLFLLLETGLEIDVSAAWRQRGPALRIGIIGVLVPLALGFVLTLALPASYFPDPVHPYPFALFLGTTMAISAMVIIARVLHDLDLVKSDLGLVTLCGYAVNDLLAWLIFSMVLAYATSRATDLWGVVGLLALTVAFVALCLTVGLRLVDRAITSLARRHPNQPGFVLSVVCCVGLLIGTITEWMGVTALLGFFLAGVMAGQTHALSERTRQVISQMVHSIFVPLYFASIGLGLDFVTNFDGFIVGFVVVVSIVAKFAGAWLGAIGSDLSSEDRISVGIAFTPSGVTGIVVASVALDAGILTPPVFVAIVVSTIVSCLLIAPWLEWSIRRRKAVNVLDFLHRRAVVPDLTGATRWDAIDELCTSVAELAGMPPREKLVEAVRAREEAAGTAVGHGIAIPHARMASLRSPTMALGRSEGGVDWDAPDGEPVRLAFLLLTPETEHGLQLQILAAIAAAMVDEQARASVVNAPDAPAIIFALQDALRRQDLARVAT
jgi:Kef-type K+ transport system membrane component KefB